MALDATILANEIKGDIDINIRAAFSLGAPPLYPKLTQYAEAMANAIAIKMINHIKANAELNNVTFSGTFPGTVSGATCSTTITNQPVTGGIK